jgi:hypothetical protein
MGGMTLLRCVACVGALATVLACGDSDEDGEGSGTGTTDTGSTTMEPPTTDPTPGTDTSATSPSGSSSADASSTMPADESSSSAGTSTTGFDGDLQHGFVRVQLQRAADRTEDPFVGTERMQITLNYEQCIFDFYVANPEWAQDGDNGESVFGSSELGGEGWFDRLCNVDVPDLVECEVASIEQQLDPIPVLRITYVVSGELDGAIVPFGPLPTAALAACEGGTEPTVRLTNGNLVVGYDAGNEEIWDGADYAPAIVATDDAEAIVVDIARTN